jgi:hypothetical protein
MANKPFAIQGADLTLGGVNLSAGTTGVVIPGVTQAVNYLVEEVDENGSDESQDLGDDAGAITVIDNSRYLQLTGTAPSADYVAATYSVDELDDGNIEEITVETAGVFLAADKNRVEASNMWATLDATPFVSFNSANWQQIPFRPKMRAGEVENIGGGGITLPSQTGQSGKVLTTDGSTLSWTDQTGGSSGAIGTFFVVVNESGEVSKSTDGISWTTGADLGSGIERVATNGVTVAMIQSDQLSWTTFAGLEASTYVSGSSGTNDEIGGETVSWNQIDYAGGYFVAVGRYTPTGSSFDQGVYGYSTDGRSWTFDTVDQTVVEFFANDPVDSNWQFSDVDYNGVGWMFSVSDINGGDVNGGGVYITDLTATVTSARCFSMNITYKAAWNGSAWYMEGGGPGEEEQLAGVNTNFDPRNGTFAGPIDPWATAIQDLGLDDAGTTVELAGGNGYIAASDSDGHVAWSDDNGQTWQIVTPIPYTRNISAITQASPAVVTSSGANGESGEKIIISGSSVSGYNGTFYWKSANSSLYTDQALTTPFDTSGLAPFTGTATLTWSHGEYIDAMDFINGYFYIGNDDEQIARTVDFVTWTIVDDQTNDFDYWNDIAGFVGTGGDIGDIVVEVDSEYTKLTLANKDFTLETTRTSGQDADINLYAADDIFIEANGDDITLSAKDQVVINTRWDGDFSSHSWTFNGVGQIEFPDGSVQTTAYPSADIWVQEFETSLGAADTPAMAASVEYLPDGDIVALMIHSENTGGGFTGSYSSVARLTSAGVKVWSMAFKGADYTNPWGLAVSHTGHIYVAGSSSTNGGYEIATLTKLSQIDGAEVWSQAYDVGVSNYNTVVDVDSFGQPIVVGYVNDEGNELIVTSKINADTGAVTWSRALDGQGDENAYGMAVGPSGEVVTVGWMTQFGVTDAAATLYTDPVSNVNWAPPTSITVTGSSGATYTVSFTGGVPTFTNIVDPVGGRTVDQTLDTLVGASFGGETGVDDMIVKVGTLAASDTADRMLIVKYNSAGSIQWQKAVQVLVGFDCQGADADIDSEGNIYVCGNFDQDSGGQAMIIIKFNSLGVKQWTRTLQGNCGNFATSIVVSPDNFLYLSAVTIDINVTNMVIAKYDTTGDLEWQRLLTNTDGMTFAGNSFFNTDGGSNLAVRDGYVAVGGGFGDLDNFPDVPPNAIVTQFLSRGDVFLAGNYEFETASFSGDLDDTASDITVVNAGKGDSNFAGAFTPTDFDPDVDLTSDLIGTLYHGVGDETRLFNGGQSLVLETTGAVTLPKGGTVTEGVVTSNPTIQLTPARPDVASQKLVIKGGANFIDTTANNNIQLRVSDSTAIVGDTVTFYIEGSNTYANQTLYWWTYPEGLGVADADFGTVAIDGDGDGTFTILIDRDDYEFTVRVSPINGQYDPDNLGVESVLINASEPTYPDYHLHLTTGNLTETSIFLGTDDHNVRTTTDGKIQITTGGQFNICTILNAGSGYASGDPVPAQTTGGTGTGMTADFGYGISGQLVSVSVNDPGTGYTDGDVITVGGGTGTFVLTRYNDLANQSNGNSLQAAWDFSADGTLTIPDGGIVGGPVGTNKIDLSWDLSILAGRTIKINPGSSGVVSPTFWSFSSDGAGGGITLPAGSTFDDRGGGVLISGAGREDVNRFYTKISETEYRYPNSTGSYGLFFTGGTWSLDVLGEDNPQYTSTDLSTWTAVAGAAPAPAGQFSTRATRLLVDNKTWTFSGDGTTTLPGALVKSTVAKTGGGVDTETAIDLTKSINKLTDGLYTLADGVEGQIMYLVKQTGTVFDAVTVIVENARTGGILYTNLEHYPFDYSTSSIDIDTLIFTDGAWQAVGGAWD